MTVQTEPACLGGPILGPPIVEFLKKQWFPFWWSQIWDPLRVPVQTERAYVGGPIFGTPIVNLFLLLSCHDELGGPPRSTRSD